MKQMDVSPQHTSVPHSIPNTECYPAVEYSKEIEAVIIDHFLNASFDEAIALLQSVIDKNIGKTFQPYICLELKCRFMSTLIRILYRTDALKHSICLPGFNLGVEVYGKSLETIKSELLLPFYALKDGHTKALDRKDALQKRIQNYIQQNLCTDFSLTDLADKLGFSVSYTSKLFKDLFGDNFKHYVNQCKIDLSKTLLAGNTNLSEVAKATGFLHKETFIKIFKAHTGMTPKEYIERLSKT